MELLPYKNEYILELINNNYSMHTIDCYRRDLEIFELFLKSNNIKFKTLNKLEINKYKGYLRTGQHLLDIDKKSKIKENNVNIVKKTQKDDSSAESDVESGRYRKSLSKGSRNGRSISSGLSGQSVNRMLSSLRAYLAFLDDIDQKIPIPPNAIKLIKAIKTEKQVADFKELVELIESPEVFEAKRNVKFRNRAILELLFSTGMRISELVHLNRSDLKLNVERKVVKDNKLFILGKGKKQRYVYLTERAIEYLNRYLGIRGDEYPALFIPYRGQRKKGSETDMVRISQRYVQSVIRKYKERLGIQIPTTPHSLRHGFATYLAEQGANPAAIQRLLGHESLQTTTRYVHASDKFAQGAHAEFHPLK